VEQGVVGQQRLGQRRRSPHLGQLAHPGEVSGPLRVQEPIGVPTRQQRQHHLGEQDRLQVRLGRLRLGKPALEVGDALLGDGVQLALGTLAGFGADDDRPAVAFEPAQRGVHLPERKRLVVAKALVEGPLELVTMRRRRLKEPQKGERCTHRATIHSKHTLSK
jgi:hypothetical protein